MATFTSIAPSDGADYGLNPHSGRRTSLSKIYRPNVIGNILSPLMYADVVSEFYDFNEVTFNGDPFTVTKDAGATTWAIAAGAGGMIRGVTGATSGDGLSLLGSPNWYGDRRAGMEVRAKSDVATTLTMEGGFINAVTDMTTPAVTDIDSVTFGAGLTEGAVITIDVGETLTTFALATKSGTYTTAFKKVFYGPAINGTTGVGVTAGEWVTLRVQLDGDNVHGFIYNNAGLLVSEAHIPAAGTAALTGGIEGGTALKPWFAAATQTTASKNIDVDYIRVWQDRFV